MERPKPLCCQVHPVYKHFCPVCPNAHAGGFCEDHVIGLPPCDVCGTTLDTTICFTFESGSCTKEDPGCRYLNVLRKIE